MTRASQTFSIRVVNEALPAPDFIVLQGESSSYTIRKVTSGETWTGSRQNCRELGVGPGHIVQFEAGLHGARALMDLIGTPEQPVIVRSDPAGQVVIRRSSADTGGFVLALDGFRHAILDGSTTADAPDGYGFKILHSSSGADAPSAFVKVGDSDYATENRLPSSFFALRYIDIDGGWPSAAVDGIGISINDHESCRYTENQVDGVPTLYRESILIEHCRVRNTEGEGMYVGPNWRDTTPSFPNPAADDLPLRNIEIRYNEIDNTSWDLCNCKSWIAGDNKIHHNVMRNGSQALDASQNGGITANNCHVQIYNNWVENTGNPGIQTYMFQMPASLPFGPFEAVVYNNVVCNLFTVPGDQAAKGINAGAEAGSLPITAFVYHNTVVQTPGAGISTSGGAPGDSVVTNNLLAETAPISGSDADVTNNLELSMADARFVDGPNGDFRLDPSSPARNQAQGSYVPATDYRGVGRPSGSAADIGAYEYEE